MRLGVTSQAANATQKAPRLGSVLLEVVLALVLFMTAVAIVTASMNAAVDSLTRMRLNTHAVNLATSVLSELKMGVRSAEGNNTGEFDPPFENWTWELQMEAVPGEIGDTNQLMRVEVIVRHSDEPIVQRLTQWMRLEETRKGTNVISF